MNNSVNTKMKVHILNGDNLQQTLQAENFLIVREMLVEGPLKADSWESFFQKREIYLAKTYSISSEEYQKKSVSEFEKIKQIASHSEVYLWFDYDLFCFVNLLFVVSVLGRNKTIKLFLVRPLRKRGFRIWRGFEPHTKADLMRAFSKKIQLQARDVNDLLNLWNRLGGRATLKYHRLIPFLHKHFQDYSSFEHAKKIEASWGFTDEQIKRIRSL